MGSYYYRSPLISYTGSITGGEWTPSSETTLTNIVAGKTGQAFTGPITIVNTSVQSPSLNTIYKSSLTLSATANNIYSTSVSVSATPLSYIIDGPSYTLIKNTLAQTQTSNPLTTSTIVYGCRSDSEIIDGVSTFMPTFSLASIFDNTVDITTNQELQVSNGYFVTPTTTSTTLAYINYDTFLYDSLNLQTIDYSGISASGFRYATFVWKITSGVAYTNLSFTINGTLNMSKFASLLGYSGDNTPIQMYYRTVNSTSSTPIDGSNQSSSWINVNATDATVPILATAGNWQNNTVEGSEANIRGASSLSSSDPFILSVFYPLSGVSVDSNMYIIFRIGLPMNKNIGFRSITALLS